MANDAACNLLIPGTNGTSWNCVLNWTGGAALPGVGDIAVFNSSTTTSITIDTSISVAQIDIQAGYTGTITQAAGNTITIGSSGFSQAAGTFTGGNSAITINGPFSLSSGTFTATTGTTSVTGDVTVSGGTFNHSSGLFTLTGSADQAINLGGKVLNNLTINNTGGGTSDDIVIANNSQLLLSGSLIITLGNLDLTTNTEAMVVEKGMTLADASQATLTTNSNVTASGTILINDAATITVSAGTWTLNDDGDQAVDLDGQSIFNLTLNDTGGGANDDIIIAGGGLNLSGTLTVTLGNLDLTTNSQSLVTEKGITLANTAQATLATNSNVTASGTILINDASTLTVTAGTWTLNDDGDQAVDLDGQPLFNLTINDTGGGTNDDIVIAADSQLLLSGSLVITLGNLDLSTNTEPLVIESALTLANAAQATLITNTDITVGGNVTVNDAATITTSAGTFTLNGTADQTVDLDGQSVNNLTLNNTGGGASDDIVIAAGSPLLLSGSLTITLGNLDLATNDDTLVVERGITLADAAQATFTTDQDVTASGSVLINDAATITVSAGTWILNDDGDQSVDFDGQALYNLTINDTGGGTNDDVVIAASSPLLLSGSLTVTLGHLDLATNTEPMVVDGSLTLADAAQATLTTNDNLTIGGNITVNNAATLTVSAGTLTLNGTADQAIDFDSQPVFNLVINNSGGGTSDDIVIAADSQLLLSGSLVMTLGNLDLSTNTEVMVVEKGITLADAAQSTLITNSNVTASGTILVNDAATITVSAGTWTLNDDGDQNVDLDGQSLSNLTINNTGGGTNDDVVIAGGTLALTGDLTVTLGNLDLDTNALSLDVDDDVTLAASGQATLSGSTMNIGGDILVASAATFTNTTGTVTLDGSGQSLSGALTINNLTKSATSSDTLTFAATNTVTVRNETTLQGTAGATLSLRSSQTGTAWKIDPQGADTFLYLDIKDSNNINAFAALCPTGCTDSGNNSNWSITVAASGGGASGGSSGGSTGGGGGGRRSGLPDIDLSTKTIDQVTGGNGGGSTADTPTVDAVLQQAVLQGQVCQNTDEANDPPSRGGYLSAEMGEGTVVFTDVPVNAWFAPNVYALMQAGIASGYKDIEGQPTGFFGAANNVTYAELVKMILETTQEQLPDSIANQPNNISAIGHWSERYMKFAEDLNLSVYKPDLNIHSTATRGEVIKTLMEAFDIPMDTQMADYQDLDESHQHAAAISTATRLCIIHGDTDAAGNFKGTVRPDDSINRAEVSEIIQRILSAE